LFHDDPELPRISPVPLFSQLTCLKGNLHVCVRHRASVYSVCVGNVGWARKQRGVKVQATTRSLSACTALHCTALHCPALHCTVLHFTALHCTPLHSTALHCTALHCTVLHCTALHCTALLADDTVRLTHHMWVSHPPFRSLIFGSIAATWRRTLSRRRVSTATGHHTGHRADANEHF
jgi:hypothetical protein